MPMAPNSQRPACMRSCDFDFHKRLQSNRVAECETTAIKGKTEWPNDIIFVTLVVISLACNTIIQIDSPIISRSSIEMLGRKLTAGRIKCWSHRSYTVLTNVSPTITPTTNNHSPPPLISPLSLSGVARGQGASALGRQGWGAPKWVRHLIFLINF